MIAVYILIAVASAILILSFVKINITADFAYKSDNNELYIKFLFIKAKLYPHMKNTDKTANETETDSAESVGGNDVLKKLGGAKKLYNALKKDILKLLNYVFQKALAVSELNVSAVIGTGNPMYTGIVYGAVNAAVFGFLGAADRKMKIKQQHTEIKADFDKPTFSAGIYAVVYTRAIHLYYLAARSLVLYIKLKHILNTEGRMKNE